MPNDNINGINDDKFSLRLDNDIFNRLKNDHIGESKNLSEYVSVSRDRLEKLFAAVLHSTGGGYTDPLHYYTTFNSMDIIPYFDPHVAGRLHVFFVRPVCNIRDDNLDADSFLTGLLNTIEGNIILSNLFNPICNPDNMEVNNKKTMDDLMNHYRTKVYGEDAELISNLFANDTPVSPLNTPIGDGSTKYSTVYTTTLKLSTSNIRSMAVTPFMPLLTNMCIGLSGIPDLVIGKFQYDGDFQQNQQVIASGMDENNGPCEVTFTFRENSNLGVTALHLAWMLYMHNVSKGKMSPFPGFVRNKIIDYMTSVYWFFVGQDGMSIKTYGRFTGGFPLNVPISSVIVDKRGGSSTLSEVSITYSFSHKELMKPIILYEFNTLVKRSIGLLKKIGSETGVTITPFPVLNATFTNNNSVQGDRVLRKELNETKGETSASNMFGRIYSGNNGELYPSIRNLFRGHPVITYDGKLLYCDLAYKDYKNSEGKVEIGKTKWIKSGPNGKEIETPYIE